MEGQRGRRRAVMRPAKAQYPALYKKKRKKERKKRFFTVWVYSVPASSIKC
jgi:ribosomal protein L20